jgi:hypothetical protein
MVSVAEGTAVNSAEISIEAKETAVNTAGLNISIEAEGTAVNTAEISIEAEELALDGAGAALPVGTPLFDMGSGYAINDAISGELAATRPAGLDEGLSSLPLFNLLYIKNPYSYNKCQ